jgi:hypothetical protein
VLNACSNISQDKDFHRWCVCSSALRFTLICTITVHTSDTDLKIVQPLVCTGGLSHLSAVLSQCLVVQNSTVDSSHVTCYRYNITCNYHRVEGRTDEYQESNWMQTGAGLLCPEWYPNSSQCSEERLFIWAQIS